ncbi:MAG: insulinase family protein, partial [Myxococcota bacterium]
MIAAQSDAAGLAQAATQVSARFLDHHRYNDDLLAARFALANGLTIVLMVDRRAPVFAYQTWFRVGSRHEDPERTGLAHLFEHLMFKGTRTHPTGTFDREMERRGTQTNAATWVDWTFYTQSLAARGDNLETLAGFEADRMRNLVLDEKTFRSELEVVKNERRMSVEDSIGGM